MQNCKISVIIPESKNISNFKKCINSVRFQTYENIEIICIADKMSENSRKLLEEYRTIDDRIIAIYKENLTLTDALNAGLNSASGDYISFLSPDNWLLLTLYQEFVDIIHNTNRKIDTFIFNGCAYLNNENDIFPNNYFEIQDWNNHKFHNSIHKFSDCQKPFSKTLTLYNKIYRTAFIKNEKIVFPMNLEYGDISFCIECLLKSGTIVVDENVLCRFRPAEKLINTPKTSPRVMDIFKVIDLAEKIINQQGFYENSKYAFFQYKYNTFSSYYSYCPEKQKEAYYNEMKYRLLSAQTQDLDVGIASHLKNYEIFETIKNSNRKNFDKYYKKHNQTLQ